LRFTGADRARRPWLLGHSKAAVRVRCNRSVGRRLLPIAIGGSCIVQPAAIIDVDVAKIQRWTENLTVVMNSTSTAWPSCMPGVHIQRETAASANGSRRASS